MNSCNEGNLPNNSETHAAATGAPSMKNKRKHTIVAVEISNVMPRKEEEETNWHCRPEQFSKEAVNGKHPKPKEHSEINKGFYDTTNLHDHPREMNNRLDDSLNAKRAKSKQNKILNPYLKKKIAADYITRVASDIPSTLGHGHDAVKADADRLDAVVDMEKGHAKKDTEKDPLHHSRRNQAQSEREIVSDQKLEKNERGNMCTVNAQENGSRRTIITHQQFGVVKNPYRKDPMSLPVVPLNPNPYFKRQTNNNVSASIATTRQLNSSRQPQEMSRHVAAPLPNNPTSNMPTHHSHNSHSSTDRPSIPVSTSSNASTRTMPINPYKSSSNHTSALNGNGQGLQTTQTASTNNPYNAAVSGSSGVPRPSGAVPSPVHYNPYKNVNRDIRNETHSLDIQQSNPINPYIMKPKSRPSTSINSYATKTISTEDETSIREDLYQHHEGRPPPVPRPLFINGDAPRDDENNNDVTLSSSSRMNPDKCANQSANPYKASPGQSTVAPVDRPWESASDSANAESDQDDLVIVGVTQNKDRAPIPIKSSVHRADAATRPKNNSESNTDCRPKSVLNAPSSTSLNQPVKPANQNTASVPSNKTPLPPELAYDESRLKAVNDEYRLPLIKAADLGGTLKNGWTLLPHQKVGILKAIQMRRLILAYDMGLGKTLIGCVYAKAFKSIFPNLKVHVIAPVSLKKEWMRTASDVVGLKCEEEKKGAKGKLDQESLDIRVSSWGKVPLRVPEHIESFVVICDEAHNLQSMDSARTKDTLKLVLSEKCIGCLLLTGTPMKNGKPSNLFPLLRAARHPFGDDQKRYEFFFCNGMVKNFGNRDIWDASGSSNLGMLNAHIVSHMLHKTKDECLKDLPGKKREHMKVPVGSKYEIQHNRALNELAKIFKSLSSTANDSGGNDAILGAFARLRQVAAFAKIEATIALAKTVLKEEPSVVIFTYFVDVAKEVHKGLESAGWTGELLAGETPSAKRQQMVDNFQSGVSPVFIGTFGAAGVGITLTAARTIILVDRPWTPGDALQAEDRVRRIGQTKEVRSIWMRAFDIDEQIDDLIEFKNQNANSVMNKGNMQVNYSKAAPKISIRNLVKTIVESNPVHKK